jgi:hypothetical protein
MLRISLDLDLGEGKGEWEGGERRKRGERGVEGGAESQQDGRAQSAAAMAVGPRLVDSSADEGHSDGVQKSESSS